MLEVAALTSGREVPSSRFRIRQYVPRLGDAGIRVSEYCPMIGKYAEWPGLGERVRFRYKFPMTALSWIAKTAVRIPGVIGSWRSDVTWLSRDLLVGLRTLEPLLGAPLVLDVDDAIWMTWPWGEASARRTARQSELVIAGNRVLADWFSNHARRVEIVPTAVDTFRFHPRASSADRPRLVLGWIGSGSNLPYLEGILPALREVMSRRPEVTLRVVSDRSPDLRGLDPDRIEFVRWSAAREGEDVQAMDIGLMPLPDNDWTRGKCSLKMLQYLSCGIPAVVSPVGMNQEVLRQAEVGFGVWTMGEWIDGLLALCSDQELRTRLGRNGRALVEMHYAADVIALRLAELFRSLR